MIPRLFSGVCCQTISGYSVTVLAVTLLLESWLSKQSNSVPDIITEGSPAILDPQNGETQSVSQTRSPLRGLLPGWALWSGPSSPEGYS